MFVPGRLEVFGKHTDYAGGRSLLAAVDRGITVTLADGTDGVTARTTASTDVVTVRPGETSSLPAGHWGGYVQAVVDRLVLNFGDLRPAHVEIDSNLPLASGMSSSSALVVALALALADHNGLRETDLWTANITSDIDLAGYMASFENGMTFGTLEGVRGVGTFGGSEDHTAMLCCRADHLTQFSFCPIVEHESVPFDADWAFVVAVSGVLAEKTGAAQQLYNRASLRTREVVAAWNDATGRQDITIADALYSDQASAPAGKQQPPGDQAVEQLRAAVSHSPELSARLRAFLTESEELIPAATTALADRDLETFGQLADHSQRSADEDLGNQIPETNRLQALARELGADAAAGFGAGFGGSVWALTPTADAEAFGADWLARYTAEFPAVASRATTLVTRPGGPARRL